MKILFCSNYFSHHQMPLSDALDELTENNYYFLAYKEMDAERKSLGWGRGLARPYTETLTDGNVQRKLEDLDVLIAGSFPEKLTADYAKHSKLFFRYSERILKTGNSLIKYPKRFLHWHMCNPPWRRAYLLCASGFAAGDYAKFGLFRGRCYQWGYFPETRFYDIRALLAQKEAGSIFWAGRFLDWKHPDDALRVAARLRDDGYNFTLRIAGAGVLEPQLRAMVSELHLDGCVQLLGSLRPEQVRCEMERSRIFLFTSDRREGWGAVLNEAMNSGCAVVASDAVGATPFLVKDGVNGNVYHSGDTQELYEKVRRLLDDTAAQERFGSAAYRTISELWNAETAAERLLQLSQALLDGRDAHKLFADGPCSPAHPLREDWYRK